MSSSTPTRETPPKIDAQPKIEARRLFKLFGVDPAEGVRCLLEGQSKEAASVKSGCIVAVNDVSFAVNAGEIFAVMGLSGSGKSTLIRCINQLVASTSGSLLIDGEDVAAVSPRRLRQIRLEKVAMVFQHFALFPHMSVIENVEYGLRLRGQKRDLCRQRALEVMNMVGLKDWADVAPDRLSGGMRQRVGLARALALGPQILLMDEPFGALDPLIRRDMHRELLQIQRALKMTVILITHDLHEALTLGDRIAIMRNGSFVQVGTREDIINLPADDYVSAFTQDVDRSRVLRVSTIMSEAHSLGAATLSAGVAETYMRQQGCTALYVVDDDRKPLGLITHRDLMSADPRFIPGPHGSSRFPTVSEDAPLSETFGFCGEGLPIAVVDASGRLCGKVSPGDILTALSGRPSAPDAHRSQHNQDGLFRSAAGK